MARRLEQGSSARADLSRAEIAVYLALVVGGALAVRSLFSYGLVMTPGAVNFQDNDAWYHARAVEYLAANWPHALHYDPYALFGGQTIPLAPLLDAIAATAAVMLGLGHPSPRLVEVIAAWTPAVLGALIPLPVFLATRRLLDARAALMAAALAAVFPGHLLERSRLGYLDHHVLEALLTMVTVWLAIRALQAATRKAQAIGGIAAGVSLGAYLLAWTTGSYVVGVLMLWLAVQYSAAAIRGRGAATPAVVVLAMALTALAIVVTFQDHRMLRYDLQVATLVLFAVEAIALEGLRLAIRAARRPQWLLPIAGGALGAVAFVVANATIPIVSGMVGELMRAAPDASAFTVVEAMPLVSYVRAPWMQVHPLMVLGTGLPLGLLGLVLFLPRAIGDVRPERTLVVVMTIAFLVSTLLRNRFGYYLAPMLAVLGGWICSRALQWATARPRLRDLAIVAIGGLAFAPNLWPARTQVSVDLGMPAAWRSAMDWLRAESPEPFGDPSFYLARYSGAREPGYSVMAWWDYGYWVMRRARRVPVANPTQAGATAAAAFLVESDPAKAMKILDDHKSRYVVVDHQLPLRIVPAPVFLMGKFEDLAIWAGRKPAEYFEGMFVRDERGTMRPAVVFYPAYYRAMTNRLYMFGARRVIPSSSTVITFAEGKTPDGRAVREITALRTFATFTEADGYLRSLGDGNHRLVGLDPAVSPVPLEDLPEYFRVFGSPDQGPWPGRPAVAVFQFGRP